MSSYYKKQEMLYMDGKRIKIPYKIRIICTDGMEKDPPDYILYKSKEEYEKAIEEEKTRIVGGTLYGKHVTGYDLLIHDTLRFPDF